QTPPYHPHTAPRAFSPASSQPRRDTSRNSRALTSSPDRNSATRSRDRNSTASIASSGKADRGVGERFATHVEFHLRKHSATAHQCSNPACAALQQQTATPDPPS